MTEEEKEHAKAKAKAEEIRQRERQERLELEDRRRKARDWDIQQRLNPAPNHLLLPRPQPLSLPKDRKQKGITLEDTERNEDTIELSDSPVSSPMPNKPTWLCPVCRKHILRSE